jgi:hypothetical protein
VTEERRSASPDERLEAETALDQPQAVLAADTLDASVFNATEIVREVPMSSGEVVRRLSEPDRLASLFFAPGRIEPAEGGWVRVSRARRGRPVFVFVTPGERKTEMFAELVLERTNFAAPLLRLLKALDSDGEHREEIAQVEAMGFDVMGVPLKCAFAVEPAGGGSRVHMTVWVPAVSKMQVGGWIDSLWFRVSDPLERWWWRRRMARFLQRLSRGASGEANLMPRLRP